MILLLSDVEIARFWAKVATAAPSDCWNWTASLRGWDTRRKYGQFVRGKAEMRAQGGPRCFYAHRIAWCAARHFPLNYLTDSHAILHDCDNPLCCNPSHLTLGTQLCNIRDMILKGRNRGGRSRTTSQSLEEIPV